VLLPIIMAMVLAYVVLPIVDFLHHHTRLNRTMAVALVYLVITAILIAIPVTTIPQLINQANNLISNTPGYIEDIGDFLNKPLIIGDYTIPVDELPLDQLYESISQNLIEIIRTIGTQGFNIFGSVASRTISTVLWIIIVLVLSLYMVKDYRELWASIVALAPESYHDDLQHLGRAISDTWNDFLRGQLILGIVVGTIVTIVALILELPNALLLGLLAGLLEFIPNIGPTIAAVPGCIFCGYCVEACPCDAIRMDTGLHPVPYDSRDQFIFGKNLLMAFTGLDGSQVNENPRHEPPDPTHPGITRIAGHH
jgi:predicted PurR-regulated permease PerM